MFHEISQKSETHPLVSHFFQGEPIKIIQKTTHKDTSESEVWRKCVGTNSDESGQEAKHFQNTRRLDSSIAILKIVKSSIEY
jgi:hypothetical protein